MKEKNYFAGKEKRRKKHFPIRKIFRFSSNLLRKIEFSSSWEIGGFFELAAGRKTERICFSSIFVERGFLPIRKGRTKLATRISNWWTYSRSLSTKLKIMLFRFLIISACGELKQKDVSINNKTKTNSSGFFVCRFDEKNFRKSFLFSRKTIFSFV